MKKSETNLIESTTAIQEFSIRYSYPVSFTYDLFEPSNPLLKDTVCLAGPSKQHKLIIFVDEGVLQGQPDLHDRIKSYAATYKQNINIVTEPIAMPAGEHLKSDMQFIEQMQTIICDHHIDRHSFVLGIGGGALLDAVGLVAATAHRGIRHIRIPTTVLAQNDSGVGVKNGVNLFGQKNYLGTFAPPFAVLNDYQFIETLSKRDKISGIAEAVKVALIRDVEFFEWLETNTNRLTSFNADAMRHMIKRCAELHMHQIANGGDPFESGSVRPLDFGHWAAHRLETITNYQLRHGEAVAIGIAIDSRYSVLSGLLAEGCDERIHDLLCSLGFDLWHTDLEMRCTSNTKEDGTVDSCSADSVDRMATEKNDGWEIMHGLSQFQEHLGGELTITLLKDIGKGFEVHEMDHALVKQAIQWLKQKNENLPRLAAHQ